MSICGSPAEPGKKSSHVNSYYVARRLAFSATKTTHSSFLLAVAYILAIDSGSKGTRELAANHPKNLEK